MTKTAFYNNPRFRSAFYQIVVLVAVIWFGVEFFINARANLEAQNLRFGLRFLDDPAGFNISQTLISYGEQDSYRRVFFVGLLNTLLVSGLGIVLATILGFMIGLARLSPNWLLARLAGGYVEVIRNLPLLFQILFWYLAVLLSMPGPASERRASDCSRCCCSRRMGSPTSARLMSSPCGGAAWPNGSDRRRSF